MYSLTNQELQLLVAALLCTASVQQREQMQSFIARNTNQLLPFDPDKKLAVTIDMGSLQKLYHIIEQPSYLARASCN